MKSMDKQAVADTSAIITGLTAVAHYATLFQPIISAITGIIAIISGIFAIRFYYIKSKYYGQKHEDK